MQERSTSPVVGTMKEAASTQTPTAIVFLNHLSQALANPSLNLCPRHTYPFWLTVPRGLIQYGKTQIDGACNERWLGK